MELYIWQLWGCLAPPHLLQYVRSQCIQIRYYFHQTAVALNKRFPSSSVIQQNKYQPKNYLWREWKKWTWKQFPKAYCLKALKKSMEIFWEGSVSLHMWLSWACWNHAIETCSWNVKLTCLLSLSNGCGDVPTLHLHWQATSDFFS